MAQTASRTGPEFAGMTADSGTRAFTIINPASVRRISEASAAPIVSGAASNASRTGWIASAGGLAIECLSWEEAARRTEAWRTLAAQALEANIFNEPDFALSAAQHLPQAIRPMFLFVSQIETGGISGLPVAIFALEQPRGTGIFIDRLWCPPEMPVATPLIHPEYGFAALDLLQEWLAREFPLMNGGCGCTMLGGGKIKCKSKKFFLLWCCFTIIDFQYKFACPQEAICLDFNIMKIYIETSRTSEHHISTTRIKKPITRNPRSICDLGNTKKKNFGLLFFVF